MVARYDSDDIGMRNLLVVALTDAGHSGVEVAACFGITAVYVSMLRGRARESWSAGLVRRRGRRPKVTPAAEAAARQLSAEGVTDCRDRSPARRACPNTVDWVTYRRGGLLEPTVTPRSSWFNLDRRRHCYRIADEIVDLPEYGPARQISVYEHGQVVFQLLTCDTTATPARLVHLLRCRWRIENAFKYLSEH